MFIVTVLSTIVPHSFIFCLFVVKFYTILSRVPLKFFLLLAIYIFKKFISNPLISLIDGKGKYVFPLKCVKLLKFTSRKLIILGGVWSYLERGCY